MTATWLEATPPDVHAPQVRAATPTLLHRAMPLWDATRIECRVIVGPMERVYDAALNVDMLEVVRRYWIVRALFAIRHAFERFMAVLRRRPWIEPPPPPSLRLRDIPQSGEWVLFGTDRPREAAFGAIGRFWAGETRWETIAASDFAAFNQPGFAKIGCNLLFRDLGDGGILVQYEARTRATDAASRRSFRRYWRATSPFIGIAMRSTLALIARDVAAGGA